MFEVYETNSGALNAIRITNAGAAVDSAAGISLHGKDGASTFEMGRIESILIDESTKKAKLALRVNNGGLEASTAMMIMETGSVGIGTETPTDTLDVRGTIVAPLFKGNINTSNIDIDGGTVDGSVIGGTTPAAGTFTTLTANTSLNVSSTLTVSSNGLILTSANASGTLTAAIVDINSGNIDNTIIGAATAAAGTFTTLNANTSIEASTSLTADSSGVTISSAEVSGSLTVATADINGGNLDDVTIGATTPATGTFTDITANNGITGTLQTAAQPNITSVGTLTSLTISGDLTVNTTHLFVDTSTVGSTRVGIGTASPTSELEVNGQVKASSANISGTLTATSLHITGIMTAELGELTVASAIIAGGSVNGVEIGTSSQSTGQFTNVTASSIRITSSLTATSSGLTISSADVSDTLTVATVDINAGAIDGAAIGVDSQSTGQFTNVTASSLRVSGILTATGSTLTIGIVDINGGAIDGATIGATTASSAKFTVATIDGTGDAEFFIDANANSNDSKLHFYANGSSEGSIVYNHNGTGDSELLEFSVGGSSRVFMQGNGRLGVATSTPQDLVEVYSDSDGSLTALRITNEGDTAGTAAGLRLFSDDNAGNDFEMARVEAVQVDRTDSSEDAKLLFKTMRASNLSTAMVILETGSIGIGTDTPTDTMDIRGTVVAPQFNGNLASSSVNIDGGAIDNTTIGGTTPAAATFTAATISGSSDASLIISAASDTDESLVEFYAGGSVQGYIEYTHANSNNSEVMKFGVGTKEKFYITGQGNIGVGTVSPQDQFEVFEDNSGGLTAIRIANEGDAVNSAAGISFWSDKAGGSDFEMARVESLLVDNSDTSADAKLSFKTMKDNTLSSVMMLTETGSVGIGTDTPTDTLDVRGTVVAPLFKGNIDSNSVDIEAGNIDNTVIGATTQSTGQFTNVTATSLRVTSILTATGSNVVIAAAEVTGTLTAATLDLNSLDLSGTLTAATVDLNAGNIDGVAIGEASQSTAKFTNVTATSLRVTSSLTATSTGLEISSAEVTGTLTANAMDVTSFDLSGTLTAATVDLNAGNIDGVAIGEASQSTAKFTNVTASSLRVTSSLTATATGLEISSAEVTGTLTANEFDVTSMDLSGTLTAATVDLNAGNIDGVAIGEASQSTAKFTNVTASSLRVTSSMTATATGLEISSAEVTGTLTANAMDVTSFDLSGTLTAATVDLNAGNIDGVAIGEASQSTAKFTNVTASSLRVTSSLTATATGLEISSAEVTGTLTANAMDVTSMDLSGTLTAATVDLNAGNIDGIAIGEASQSTAKFTNVTATSFRVTSSLTATSTGLEISSAEVTGTLTANEIDISSLNLSGTLTAATVDLNGGNIDGVAIGTASQSTAQFSNVTATSLRITSSLTATASGLEISSANVTGTLTAAAIDMTSLEGTSINLSGTLTAASANISGTLTAGTLAVTSLDISGTVTAATVDVNGGNLDNVTIGAATPGTATFGVFTVKNTSGNALATVDSDNGDAS